MPKLQKGKAQVLSEDEFKRLLKLVQTFRYHKRDTLLFLMSYGTGMRALELASLRVMDVMTPDGKIIEEVCLRRTKEKKPRSIYLIDPRIQKAIITYIEERKTLEFQSKLAFSYKQPLFLSQRLVGFTNKGMQKHFEYLYRYLGFNNASSHSGRRTFCTRLNEQGVDIKSISTLMGHSTIAMTGRYIEDNPVRLKKIVSLALY